MNEFNAHKARKALKKRLKEHNWTMRSFTPDDEPMIMMYVFDPFVSQEMATAGVYQGQLADYESIPEPIEVVCDGLAKSFRSYLGATEQQLAKRIEELGILMGAYMVKTQTYQALQAQRVDAGNSRHFIILLYANRHTGETNLRPYSLVSPKQILATSEVRSSAAQIIERDKTVNPGHFVKSPVVPIRQR